MQKNKYFENKVAKNYFYNLIFQFVNVCVPLISIPYLSRVLGADGIGIYSYTFSIVSYFTLFSSLGLSTYAQREISFYQDDINHITAIFWNTMILKIITSFSALILYVLFAIWQVEPLYYLLLIPEILSVTFDISWLFYGLERFEKIVIPSIIVKICYLVYIFAVVRSNSDLILYFIGVSLFNLISNLILFIYVPFFIKSIAIGSLTPFADIKTIFALFVPTIAIQIYTVLDKTMIGLITKDVFQNGYYEQATKISKTSLTIVLAFNAAFIPRIGYFYKQNRFQEMHALIMKAYRLIGMIGIPTALGLMMVSDILVPLFLGSGYNQVIPLLKILSFLILAIGMNNITGNQLLIPTKRESKYTLSVVVGAIVNLALNIILIHCWKAVGAAIASVLAETLITFIQFIFVRNEINFKDVLFQMKNYFIAGIFMVIILSLTRRIIINTWFSLFLYVIIGGASYILMLFLLKDRFFIEMVEAIKNKLVNSR